jgi:hypothetical protein
VPIASLIPGKRVIRFQPSDFLIEAIDEFLESGAKQAKIGSCIIKIATATELLLKEKLEQLCPALVLESIDEAGLQVAKLYGLGDKMLVPKELERVEIKTVSFPKLLNRVGRFFDVAAAKPHLSDLHSIRNELIHHRGRVDVARVNLLLIEKVFPFLETFTKGDSMLKIRLRADTWKRLQQLAESSADIVVTELGKKTAHFANVAKRISNKRVQMLQASKIEVENDESIVMENLHCPACRNRSATMFSGWDVDMDDAGNATSGWVYFVMRCNVCGLELEQDEIECIMGHFEKFVGPENVAEKDDWENALIEPDYADAGF